MALPINIKKLLTGNVIESDRIEYKRGWNPEVVLRSICAFANDIHNVGGGYVVVGVDELDGVAQLPPVGLAIDALDKMQKELLRICYFIQPDYFPVVQVTEIDSEYILVIWCPPGQHRPYKAPKTLGKKDAINKPYYVRKMSSTIEAGTEDERRLLELAVNNRTPFDNQANYHVSIDEINLLHVMAFLDLVKSDLRDQLTKLGKEEICRQMRIVSGASENVHPLNVGLLMFSDKPHEHFRGAQIELVEYLDDIGDRFRETFFQGPLWVQLRAVMNHFKHHIIKEQVVKVEGQAEARRFYNYPYEAIEEAIANAVFHKGYNRESSIEINVRHDQIEISNFPGPMPPVNQKMLDGGLVISKEYRNSRLGDLLKELELTEGRGTGIPKMRRVMEKNASPQPRFETDDNNAYFLTILPKNRSFEHPDVVRNEERNVVRNEERNVVRNEERNVVRNKNVVNDNGTINKYSQLPVNKEKKNKLMQDDNPNQSVNVSANVVKNASANVVRKQSVNVVRNDDQNVVKNSNESKLNDMQRLIYQLIKDNPTITAEQLAIMTKRTTRTMQRQIKLLQDMEVIKRVGAKKGGYWQAL